MYTTCALHVPTCTLQVGALIELFPDVIAADLTAIGSKVSDSVWALRLAANASVDVTFHNQASHKVNHYICDPIHTSTMAVYEYGILLLTTYHLLLITYYLPLTIHTSGMAVYEYGVYYYIYYTTTTYTTQPLHALLEWLTTSMASYLLFSYLILSYLTSGMAVYEYGIRRLVTKLESRRVGRAEGMGQEFEDGQRYAVLCYAILNYTMLCDAMLCYAMLCYAMLCHAMPCYAMI